MWWLAIAWAIAAGMVVVLVGTALLRAEQSYRRRESAHKRWESVAWVEDGHVVTAARRTMQGEPEPLALVEVDRVPVEDIDMQRARVMAEEVIAAATWRDFIEKGAR